MTAICKTYSSLGKELESGIFGDTPKLPSLENRFIIYPKGGLAFYIREKYQVLIRLPAFAFKPSQDDVGHFDRLIASDAGTYSYFCVLAYSTISKASHNTVYRSDEPFSCGNSLDYLFSWTRATGQ